MLDTPTIEQSLTAQGFAHVEAARMRRLLGAHGLAGWADFAASWDRLGMDSYMADGGRYRRRRHAAFSIGAGQVVRKPHQPHYQSRDYNALNGGLERWFEPVDEGIAGHPALAAILGLCSQVFGLPTPEGPHRDGVDWVLVLLVRRENVASGITSIFDLARRELGSFTLSEPMEAAFVDDSRVYHGVTAIEPVDAAQPAFRDVLVITFRHE